MFQDEKTLTQINANLEQSVCHATLRPQDLLPAFLDVITETPEYVQLVILSRIIPTGIIESFGCDAEDPWWDSDECLGIMGELFDVLNNYAPEGYYFGSHPGDGSDFGYWKLEEAA